MDRQTNDGGMGRICPRCGNHNRPGVKFCTGCGMMLPETESAAPDTFDGQGNTAAYEPNSYDSNGYEPNSYDSNDYVRTIYELNPDYTPPQPPKSNGALKVIVIVLACLLVAVITMVAIKMINDRGPEDQGGPSGGDDIGITDDTGDDDGEGDDAAAEDDYKSAYAEILREYETDIRNYDWQTDADRNAMTNNVLLHDLNGDGTPELLFFAASDGSEAELHIFTMQNDEATECSYYVDPDDMNHSESGLMKDINAASGTKYLLYTGKDPGTFYIAFYIGDESEHYTSVKCSMDDSATISEERCVYNYADDSRDVDDYQVDGNDVSMEEGLKELKAHRDDYKKLLMASGYQKDLKVFEKVKKDSPAATDFDDVMSRLEI